MGNNAKKIVQLIGIAFVVKGLGFFREMLLAYYYGVSITADVFIAALNIPSVIFALFGMAITTSFIPLYTEIKTNKNEEAAALFTNNVLNILVLLSVVVAILGIAFSDVLVHIFAGGFSGEAYILCNNFVKIIMITIVFTVVQYIYNAFLQTKGMFAQHSFMNLPYNVILILSIIISFYRDNYYILAIGVVIASLSQLFYLRILVKKNQFKHCRIIDIHDPGIKRMIVLIGPVFLSTAVNQLNSIIDRNLASRLAEGSISALNYSNKVNSIILEVIIMSVATIAFPVLAKVFAERNEKKENAYVSELLNGIGVLVIPLTLLIVCFAQEIIQILFGRGAFGTEEIVFVAKALIVIGIGLPGAAFREVLNRVYYAMQDTVTPVRNGIVSVLLNIVLNLALVKKYGYLGLAFATTASSIFCTVVLLMSLFKKKKGLDGKAFLVNQMKIGLATAVAVVFAGMGKRILMIENIFVYVFVFSCLILMVYSLLLVVLKEQTAESITRSILMRMKKGKVKHE